MINRILLLPVLLSLSFLAHAECDKVEPAYAAKEVMYVICSRLPVNTREEGIRLIKKVMSQYKGPPDEIVVQFVKSRSNIGVSNLPADEYVGYYYTHSNELVFWPNDKSRRRTLKLNRK